MGIGAPARQAPPTAWGPAAIHTAPKPATESPRPRPRRLALRAPTASPLLGWAFRPRNFMKNGGACFSLPAGQGPAMPPPVVFRPCQAIDEHRCVEDNPLG